MNVVHKRNLSVVLVVALNLTGSGVVASLEAPKSKIQLSRRKFEEDYQKFCFNNDLAAADAKFAWQAKTIAEMEKKLKGVIARLEKKKSEYKKWVLRREQFIANVTDSLVKIYSTMEPEAAAAQIALVDFDTAVSIITKLKPRVASSILNEMEPETAGRLVKIIVGTITVKENKEVK